MSIATPFGDAKKTTSQCNKLSIEGFKNFLSKSISSFIQSLTFLPACVLEVRTSSETSGCFKSSHGHRAQGGQRPAPQQHGQAQQGRQPEGQRQPLEQRQPRGQGGEQGERGPEQYRAEADQGGHGWSYPGSVG